MAVSPDGAHVYIAFDSPGGVAIFLRNPEGTLTQTTLTGLDMGTVPEVQTLFVKAASGSYHVFAGDPSVFTMSLHGE